MAQLHESILYQLILFGPPGTSKSHVARDIKAENLLIKGNEGRIFPITFHPEYCYGDFVVKRLLMTVSDDVLHYHIKSLFNSFLPALTPMLTILVQKKNPHLGQSFDDFFKHDGIFEEVQARALQRVIKESIEESMSAVNRSKRSI